MLDLNWVNFIIWTLAFIVIARVLRYLINSNITFRLIQLGIFVAALLWFLRDFDYEPLIALLAAFGTLQVTRMGNKKEKVPDKADETYEKQSPVESPANALEIMVWKAHKQEYWMKGESLKQWVLIFVITNRGREVVFFERVQIIFVFREPFPSMSKRMIQDFLKTDTWLRCGFYLDLPELDFRIKGLPKIKVEHDWIHTPHDVNLFNWESRKPINITPYNTYRSPDPGEKEVWCLHGKFPQQIADQLLKSELYLDSIEAVFHTDKGRNKVTGTFQMVEAMPEELRQKLQ